MGSVQTFFIICLLVFGAAASFLAIMLWSKTRDIAWMLIIIGAIAAYIEIVYSILGLFGIGSVSLVSILLSLIRTGFFIAAFAVMIVRQHRNK